MMSEFDLLDKNEQKKLIKWLHFKLIGKISTSERKLYNQLV